MGFYEKAVKETKRWEGVTNYMYLCQAGRVTVGIGFMIPQALKTSSYRFVLRSTKKMATTKEKQNEWDMVNRQKKGMRPSYYKQFTKLDLPDAEIDKLVLQKIKTFENNLKRDFKAYDKYPEEAKLALLDMAYNLGTSGLAKFKRLIKACEGSKWEDASKESKRSTSRLVRNKYVADLFKAAEKKSKINK